MKTLQFGIASIVDSNTGHGLPHPGGGIDYSAAENTAHHLPARSVTTLAQRIGARVTTAMRALRERREQHSGIQQLARLDDHMLEDIGFSRADISATQTSQLDLGQLAAQRREQESMDRLTLRKVETGSQIPVTDKAINAALYTPAKCA